MEGARERRWRWKPSDGSSRLTKGRGGSEQTRRLYWRWYWPSYWPSTGAQRTTASGRTGGLGMVQARARARTLTEAALALALELEPGRLWRSRQRREPRRQGRGCRWRRGPGDEAARRTGGEPWPEPGRPEQSVVPVPQQPEPVAGRNWQQPMQMQTQPQTQTQTQTQTPKLMRDEQPVVSYQFPSSWRGLRWSNMAWSRVGQGDKGPVGGVGGVAELAVGGLVAGQSWRGVGQLVQLVQWACGAGRQGARALGLRCCRVPVVLSAQWVLIDVGSSRRALVQVPPATNRRTAHWRKSTQAFLLPASGA